MTKKINRVFCATCVCNKLQGRLSERSDFDNLNYLPSFSIKRFIFILYTSFDKWINNKDTIIYKIKNNSIDKSFNSERMNSINLAIYKNVLIAVMVYDCFLI